MTEHKRDPEEDRCICGEEIVYWEDRDDQGFMGEGCMKGGTWQKVKAKQFCKFCDEPILIKPHTVMADPKFWDDKPLASRPDFMVHVECGEEAGLERVQQYPVRS